jgi:hypothetical protein
MPLTIDEKIAQLQAIRDQHGGDLLMLGMRDVPSLEFRKTADAGTEIYGIRHLPDNRLMRHTEHHLDGSTSV